MGCSAESNKFATEETKEGVANRRSNNVMDRRRNRADSR
jgi:hypothetical protein